MAYSFNINDAPEIEYSLPLVAQRKYTLNVQGHCFCLIVKVTFYKTEAKAMTRAKRGKGN